MQVGGSWCDGMQPLLRLSGVRNATAASVYCGSLPHCAGFTLSCQPATGCPQVRRAPFTSFRRRALSLLHASCIAILPLPRRYEISEDSMLTTPPWESSAKAEAWCGNDDPTT